VRSPQSTLAWATVPISELALLVTKGTTPTSVGFDFVDEGVNFIKVESISSEGKFLPNKFAKISGECHDGLRRSQLAEGDILFSIAGALGRTAVVQDDVLPANINQALAIIRLKPDVPIDRRFALYALSPSLMLDQVEQQRGGVAQQNLSLAQVKEFRIALPPMGEQKRIVAMLDQAFAALDRARAHAEANLVDCRKIYAAAVAAVIERRSNGQQKSLRLASLVTRLTNGYVGPTRDIYLDSGVPYLLARHVRDNTLIFDRRTHVSPEFNEKNKKSKLKAGDVLLVQSGHIGHCAVVSDEHDGHNCHAMIVISTIDKIISGSYLSAIFNTPDMQDGFQKIRTGSTVPHLTCKMVKELLIDVPPRSVQDEIMQEIELLRSRIEIAKLRYAEDLTDIANLRQSLLQKAFSPAT
jgi:type I restriction enzyme, S subunit